jgi:hypothetical protein
MAVFDRPLVVVECCWWFSRCDKTLAACKAVDFYLATIEPDGTAKVVRGIDTDYLAKEREMVRKHNDELAQAMKGPKPAKPQAAPSPTLNERRAANTANRKPPADTGLFTGKDAEHEPTRKSA